MAEFERIEKISHLRIFTHNIKIRKFMISCCVFVMEDSYSFCHVSRNKTPPKQCKTVATT